MRPFLRLPARATFRPGLLYPELKVNNHILLHRLRVQGTFRAACSFWETQNLERDQIGKSKAKGKGKPVVAVRNQSKSKISTSRKFDDDKKNDDSKDEMAEQPAKRDTGIILYTDGTPNGQKISMTLEALGLNYQLEHVDISKGKQKEEWFLKINPNGRIPAILDRTKDAEGKSKETRVFEGMAIQLYLAAKYDPDHKLSYPFDTDKYWESVQWMTWMQSGIGPMEGQAIHFHRYAPERIEYATNRYQTETKRLFSILERRLVEQKSLTTAAGTDAATAGNPNAGTEGPWVVGGKMTITDLNIVSWVNWGPWAGVELDSFPEVKRWAAKISAIPAVKKGLDTPKVFDMETRLKNAKETAEKSAAWIVQGQKEETEKHGGGK